MFRFVHAADLHLGAAFRGIRTGSDEIADQLSMATYRALDRIVKVALDETVAFVVFSGDLLNAADGNLRAWMELRRAAERLADAGIATFFIRGNHDHLGGRMPPLAWPGACTWFGADEVEPRRLEAGGGTAQVAGRSHSRQAVAENLALGYPRPDPALFSVALHHTNCGSNAEHASYAPCSLADLRATGYRYWALGHIHKRAILQDAHPLVAYAGCPQGLNPKETGPRGCLLVTVQDDLSAAVEFRETDHVRWHMESLDIGGMVVVDDLEAAVAGLLERLSPEDASRSAIVRVRLTGRGRLDPVLRKPGAVADLLAASRLDGAAAGQVWAESIEVATGPEVDLEAMATGDSFGGDFLRRAAALAGDPAAQADLRGALEPLLVHKAFGDAMRASGDAPEALWSDARLAELVQQAVAMGIDHLAAKEGAV
ncbi:MAG: DNA repair exonuclease [Armatimonadetes bacterium]|nr:DNA repair exonuclease [Armatimonadota bacterium]